MNNVINVISVTFSAHQQWQDVPLFSCLHDIANVHISNVVNINVIEAGEGIRKLTQCLREWHQQVYQSTFAIYHELLVSEECHTFSQSVAKLHTQVSVLLASSEILNLLRATTVVIIGVHLSP